MNAIPHVSERYDHVQCAEIIRAVPQIADNMQTGYHHYINKHNC
jgi:hypothetical protein